MNKPFTSRHCTPINYGSPLEQKGFTKTELDPDFTNPGGNTGYTKTVTNMPKKPTNLTKVLEVGANIATGGAYNAAKKALDYFTNKNKSKENFTKQKSDMPKKKIKTNPGYVTEIGTGKRIPVETISQKESSF